MGGDVEEVGVELVELLLPADHREAIGIQKAGRARSGVEAEDHRDARIDGGVID
jgi:hypothetical protein